MYISLKCSDFNIKLYGFYDCVKNMGRIIMLQYFCVVCLCS